MITKELWSEVLKIPLKDDPKYDEPLLLYRDEYDSRVWTEFDVHRLAYLCKEWAFSKGYNVYSLGKWRYRSVDTNSYLSYCVTIKTHNEDLTSAMNKCQNDMFYAETEPEAIFKACEWILEQENQITKRV